MPRTTKPAVHKSRPPQKTKPAVPKSKPPKVTPPLFIDPNSRYTIPEASAALRQSKGKTYADIRSGKLRVIKDGSRTYAPGTELIRRSTISAA